MTSEANYRGILADIGSIFDELQQVISTIKDDFEEENKQHPALTMQMVDHHLSVV